MTQRKPALGSIWGALWSSSETSPSLLYKHTSQCLLAGVATMVTRPGSPPPPLPFPAVAFLF